MGGAVFALFFPRKEFTRFACEILPVIENPSGLNTCHR